MGELLAAGETVYTELKNLCVWDKGSGGMGSLYRSRHELVFLFKHGRSAHVNNVELGRHGRNRTNVWTYPSPSRWGGEGGTLAAQHPTVKPVAMVLSDADWEALAQEQGDQEQQRDDDDD